MIESPLPHLPAPSPVSRRTLLKGIGLGALAGTVSLAATGCAAGGSGSTQLDVFNFGDTNEARIYDEAFAAFAAQHEGLTVKNTVVPVPSWADYVTKLGTQVAGGNPPDAINLALEGNRLAVERGLLEPLDDYVAGSQLRERIEQMPQVLLDAFTVDGTLYQVPTGWQTMAIFYNPELFAAAGVPEPHDDWTWEEFLEAAIALTNGSVMGFGLPWGFFQLHPWWLSNDTAAITDDESAPNLTDPGFVEAVQFVQDLVLKHKVSPDPTTSVDVYSDFASGRFAMIGTGRYSLPVWSQAGFTSYKAVRWPKRKSHATVIGGGGWAVCARSDKKELAWRGAEAMLAPEVIGELSTLGMQVPIYPDVDTLSGDSARDEAQQFIDTLLPDCVKIASPVFYTDLEQITMRALGSIVTGQVGVEEGLKAADDEIRGKL